MKKVILIIGVIVAFVFGVFAGLNSQDDKVPVEEVANIGQQEEKEQDVKTEANKVENSTVKPETEKDLNTKAEENNLVQFDTKFYVIEEAAKEYRECKNIKNFKDFEYDLDGDSKIDKITIKVNKPINNKYDVDYIYSIQLNGVEFSLRDDTAKVYIVDLNEDDEQVEVVIFDDGPSDDLNYTIYSKQAGKMKELEQFLGNNLKTNKQGKFVVSDLITDSLNVPVYGSYYEINDSKLQKIDLDIKEIADMKFKLTSKVNPIFFTENLSNLQKYFDLTSDGKTSNENAEKQAGLEFDVVNNKNFTILEYSKQNEMKIRYEDGTEGYILSVNYHLAG